MRRTGPIIYKDGVPYEVRLTFKGWLYATWLTFAAWIERARGAIEISRRGSAKPHQPKGDARKVKSGAKAPGGKNG